MIADTQIEAVEQEYVRRRRSYLDRLHPGLDLSNRPYRVGLSLSGGGIRSATLSLGILDSLSRLRLIHKFDYLSTVSGGGYTGAFYASLFTPPDARGAEGAGWESPAEELDPLSTLSGKSGIRHLRENGRYLSPSAGDNLKLAVIAIRGWLAVHLTIGVLLVAAFLALNLLRALLVNASGPHSFELELATKHGISLIWPVEWLRGYPAFGGWVLSPLVPLVALSAGVMFSLGWAYWLTRYDTISPYRLLRIFGPSTIGTVLVSGLCLYPAFRPAAIEIAFRIIGVLAAGAAAFYVIGQVWGGLQDRKKRTEADHGGRSGVRAEEESRVRNILTNWTAKALKVACAIAALALVETISQTIYVMYLQQGGWRDAIKLAAVVGLVIPVVRQIVGQVQKSGDFSGFVRRFGRTIALISAIAIAFVIALLWATVAQYLAWRGGAIGGLPALIPLQRDWALTSLAAMSIVFAVIALLMNMSVGFLNLSTFSAFYAGRLRRAYLGASNPDRMANANALGEDDQGDDITLWQYYRGPPDAEISGAPLHLINVTLNETHGKRNPGLVQRDRKGRPLTISPAGYLVPGEGDELQCYDFNADQGEHAEPGPAQRSPAAQAWGRIASGRNDLPLSNWIAISGAALSTGLGRNTSLGLSLLAGLSNLRLGVWWPKPDAGRLLSLNPFEGVFAYLWKEFTARFAGIYGARWYLTDGGHFENTGVYELVRRRVELIVCCDNGADPDYTFEDVVNLARKLRIDFGAQLEFLPNSKLDILLGKDWPDRGMFGELGELVRYSKENGQHGPYAAIARIRITPRGDTGEQEYCGTLILLKPRLTGLEMVDLVDYHRVDQTFPQQTTSDQFFDEAQWESYFRLGSIIADKVFGPSVAGDGYWFPGSLEPVPDTGFDWFCRDWPTERPATAKQEGDKGPSLAAAAAPGTVPAAGGVGPGRLLLAVIAGLATAGVATGVGQSLTNAAVQGATAPSAKATGAETSATEPGSERTFVLDGGTIEVSSDAEVTPHLQMITTQLGTIIEQLRPIDSGLREQLVAIRIALQGNISSQEPEALNKILAQIVQLRAELKDSGTLTRGELDRIDKSLQRVASGVREAAPRRNIRGSAQ